MPDLYANITEVDPEIQETLAAALEVRAADPRQQEMLKTYLGWIDFPEAARVLDVGCGTGAVTRALARWPGVASVVGVDPSPVFLEKARQMSAQDPQVSFQKGDARALAFDDDAFDIAVVAHQPGADEADALRHARLPAEARTNKPEPAVVVTGKGVGAPDCPAGRRAVGSGAVASRLRRVA